MNGVPALWHTLPLRWASFHACSHVCLLPWCLKLCFCKILMACVMSMVIRMCSLSSWDHVSGRTTPGFSSSVSLSLQLLSPPHACAVCRKHVSLPSFSAGGIPRGSWLKPWDMAVRSAAFEAGEVSKLSGLCLPCFLARDYTRHVLLFRRRVTYRHLT